MAHGTIMVGFENLNAKQAEKLLAYADEKGLIAKKGDGPAPATPATDDGKKPGRGRPKKTDPETGQVLRTVREVTAAAKVYTDTYSADATKTVLNHFGATSVSGKEGVPEDKLTEVYDIFTSGEEFVPGDTIADEFPDADDEGENDGEKKKGKGKKGKDKKGKGKKGKNKDK